MLFAMGSIKAAKAENIQLIRQVNHKIFSMECQHDIAAEHRKSMEVKSMEEGGKTGSILFFRIKCFHDFKQNIAGNFKLPLGKLFKACSQLAHVIF